MGVKIREVTAELQSLIGDITEYIDTRNIPTMVAEIKELINLTVELDTNEISQTERENQRLREDIQLTLVKIKETTQQSSNIPIFKQDLKFEDNSNVNKLIGIMKNRQR